jgi:hypothetical protein
LLATVFDKDPAVPSEVIMVIMVILSTDASGAAAALTISGSTFTSRSRTAASP